MAFSKEQYERRKELTQGQDTGENCSVCKMQIILDKNIDLPFCGCGYRQWQRNGKS